MIRLVRPIIIRHVYKKYTSATCSMGTPKECPHAIRKEPYIADSALPSLKDPFAAEDMS